LRLPPLQPTVIFDKFAVLLFFSCRTSKMSHSLTKSYSFPDKVPQTLYQGFASCTDPYVPLLYVRNTPLTLTVILRRPNRLVLRTDADFTVNTVAK